MNNYFIAAVFSLFLLQSCKQENKIKVESVGSTTFDISFEPYTYGMGYLQGKDTVGCYYFASFRTNKGYALCSNNGGLIKYTPFKSKIFNGYAANTGICAINKGSILVYANDENTLFQLNDTGGIINTVRLNPEWNGYTYDCIGNMMCMPPGGKSVFLIASFRPSFPLKTGPAGEIERYDIRYSGPVLGEVENGKPGLKWHLAGFQKRYTPPGHEGEMFVKYALSEDCIFLYTPFCDTLYKLSIAEGKVMKSVVLESKFTELGIKPHKITAEPFNGQDWTNHVIRESGLSWTIKYDPYHKLLYLPMYHAVKPGSEPISEEKSRQRKWSLMVFDENLQKLGEVPFPGETYNPMAMIVTPTELLIQKIDHSAPIRKTIFERFKISRD